MLEKELRKQIEAVRLELHNTVQKLGLSATETLILSQQLDELLNTYQAHTGVKRHVFIGKFPLGQVVATQGVMANVSEDERVSALNRHINGDWGNVCDEDKASNDTGLLEGQRLISAYDTAAGKRFWIITEWDRSVTTFLLPEEY